MKQIHYTVSKLFHFLKYKIDSLLYRLGTRKKLNIVIILQAPQSWANVHSIYQELNRRGHTTTILSLPFLHHRSGLIDARDYLKTKGIPSLSPSELDLKSHKPDAIILTSPYDSTRPPEYSFDNLYKLNCKLIYIPYGLEIGGGDENLRYQFDLETQNKSDLVFARSNRHLEMFRKYGHRQAENVKVTGHPRFDLHFQPIETPRELIEFKDGKKLILWCTHFATEPNSWSTFNGLGQEILNYFKSNELPFKVVFRPHPLLIDDLKSKYGFTFSENGEYVRLSDNLLLDLTVEHIPSMMLSDVMITDAGSFLLEYFATGKPLIYTNNPNGPSLNDDGEVAKFFYIASHFEQVKAFLEDLKNGTDTAAPSRLAARAQFLFGLDGQVAKRAVDEIEFPTVTWRG